MRLPRFLARILRRPRSIDPDAARYAAADGLEQRTQAHYRNVTGVDASGRTDPAKSGRPREK